MKKRYSFSPITPLSPSSLSPLFLFLSLYFSRDSRYQMDPSSRRVVEALWGAAQAVKEAPDERYCDAHEHGEDVTYVSGIDYAVLFEEGISAEVSRRMLRVMEKKASKIAADRLSAIQRYEASKALRLAEAHRAEEEATIAALKARLKGHERCAATLPSQTEEKKRQETRQKQTTSDAETQAGIEAARERQLRKEKAQLAAALEHCSNGIPLDPVVFLDVPGLKAQCKRILQGREGCAAKHRELNAAKLQAIKETEQQQLADELEHYTMRHRRLRAL